MPDPIAKSQGTTGAAGRARALGRIMWHTLTACVRYRVTGLAAEVAFFALLSLPPLIFGLAGSVGVIASRFPVTTVEGFRDQILHYAARFITPDAVNEVIAPTLDEVLFSPRFEIVSLGFLIALWSGSRAMAVFVDTITIMYGLAGERGIIRTRVLSFGVYVAFLVGGAIILPLVVAGPRVVDRLLPDVVAWLGQAYWPIVLVVSVLVLCSLLHLATPVRNRWRAHLPGAVLTVLAWVVGSWALRWGLLVLAGTASIFGPLAAPITLLAWLYLIAFAVLVGGALNAAIAKVAPRFAGITAEQASHVLDRPAKESDSP
ncbi:YihY/virulence factor BrkB family protein [Naumannella sp. ID2617S]|nr:YihY/virulence factor BrkB family protein [Naumannella sp. ID2617S]